MSMHDLNHKFGPEEDKLYVSKLKSQKWNVRTRYGHQNLTNLPVINVHCYFIVKANITANAT